MLHRPRYLGLLLVAVLTAPAQSSGQSPPGERDDRVASLSRRLGAADFSVRRQAESELLELGPGVLPSLRAMQASASLEARRRLERIITVLDGARRAEALSELRISGHPDDPELLAAWHAFRKLVGWGADSRDLFIEIARIEPWIVGAVAGTPEELRRDFERRAADVWLQRMQRQQSQRSIATVAALLFAAQQPDCFPSSPAVACINSCIQEGPFLESMQRTLRPAPLERLVAVWVSDASAMPAYPRLQLAARFDLVEGVDVALQIIEQRLAGPPLQNAILYLAKAGNTSHLHELELLLADETDLQHRQQKSVTTYSSRVQDVALLALLHLTGQDPQAYGFAALAEDSLYIYKGTIGFDDNEKRLAALTKWKRWSARNLKQVQPFVEQAAAGHST